MLYLSEMNNYEVKYHCYHFYTFFFVLGGKRSLSPGKDGDKMSPYPPGLLYPPQLLRDDHSEDGIHMDLCKLHNAYIFLSPIIIVPNFIFSSFTAWGPNDTANFKIADDTSDRSKCITVYADFIASLCVHNNHNIYLM